MPKPKVFLDEKLGKLKMECEFAEFNKVLMPKKTQTQTLIQKCTILQNSLESISIKDNKDKIDERFIKLLKLRSVSLPKYFKIIS